MTKHTIELAGDFAVSKGSRADGWKETATIALAGLSTEMVQELVMHGLRQKIADAASGAKTPDEAKASMGKAIDALLAGEWSSRTAGDGASEETLVARSVMRGLVKAKYGAKSEEWATFTGLEPAEQNTKLDAMATKNADAIAAKVAEEIARRKAARADKAKLAGKVDIEL